MKHLYVHIPFCNSICTYCDFVRFVSCNKEKEEYINKIIKQIKQKSKNNIYLTVYIGGGTPNSISDKLLTKLLKCIKKYINKKTEFTIELNPELITPSQASILKKYSVNRVSIGIQSVDSTILKKYNRSGNIEMYEKAIRTIKKTGIVNISCDFIYGFNEGDPEKQIIDDLEFLTKNNINHASFYSLEVKDNSIIAKQNYVIDEKRIDNQLLLIEKIMPKKGFERYEVSS
jgi:oxygen-independent coproporphyrinogen-3 oxidase